MRLRLLGGVELELDGERVALPERRAARLLLAWLAVNPGTHPRGRLAARFWPDVLDESARASLRVTLSSLRRTLGGNASQYLIAGREEIGFASDGSVSTDIGLFRELVAAGDLEAAVRVGEGELLPEFDEDWVHDARDEHRRALGAALARLGEAAEQSGDIAAAVDWTRRRLALDPTDEACARDLMHRLALQGDRAGAVRVFERLRERLRTELGLAPGLETRTLAESVARHTVPQPGDPDADVGEKAAPAPLASAEERPFVGRHKELSELTHLVAQPAREVWTVRLLAGEPGIGKTRLAARLAAQAAAAGMQVLYGRCYEEPLAPYQPFVEALGRWTETTPEHMLESDVAAAGSELARIIPSLASITGAAEVAGPDPEAARFRLFEAVAGTLGRISGRTPLLLVLDDLHWADQPTLLMLKHLVRSSPAGGAVVLATYRDTEVDRQHPFSVLLGDVARDQNLAHVRLAGLERTETADVVGAWSHGEPPNDLVDAIHRSTEGNPFFVEEVLRHLTESGRLLDATAAPALAELGVPEGVKHVIERRVARLGDNAIRLLRVGAVAGRELELRLLEAVSELSGDPLLDAVDELLGAHLIVEDRARPDTYVFSHALVREALYEELSGARRARVHQRIGEALEQICGADPGPRVAELARHFHEAARVADASKAVQYGRLAAQRAASEFAYEEAVEHYRRALEALGRLERPNDEERCDLLLALGDALYSSTAVDEAKASLVEAADVTRQIDSAERLARAALGYGGRYYTRDIGVLDDQMVALLEESLERLPSSDSALRAEVLARLAEGLLGSAPRERVLALAAEGLAMARRVGDDATAHVLNRYVWTTWSPDTLEERLALTDESIRLGEAIRDERLTVQAHSWSISHHLENADADAYEREMAAHEREGGVLRDPYRRWAATMYRAGRRLFTGPLTAVEALAQEALEIGQESGNQNAVQIWGAQILFLRREQDRLGEMREAVRVFSEQYPGIPAWRCAYVWLCAELDDEPATRTELAAIRTTGFAELPRDHFWLPSVAVLAEAIWYLRDRHAADELYELLLPFSDRCAVYGGFGLCLGSAARPLGLLAALLGRDADVDGHFETALEVNARMGSEPWLGHTCHEYAATLLARGAGHDRDTATRLLDRAGEIARKHDMPALARRIGRLHANA